MEEVPAARPVRNIASRKLRWILAFIGTLLLVWTGWRFSFSFYGIGVRHLSFDVPVFFRNEQVDDVCIVYMDDRSARELDQPYGVWQRSIHARLLDRLREDGAKAVFFDLVWYGPSPDARADEALVAALKASGNVYLGGGLEVEESGNGAIERVVPPFSPLRKAAAGWGLVAFRPVDADYCVRQIYAGTDQVPSATWRLAAKLGARIPAENDPSRADKRWVRYYGPVDTFPSQSYADVLQPNGVAPGFFREKVVFVGGRSSAGILGLGKDDFFHPHTRLNGRFATGVEVHATIFRNLWRGEWLRRLSSGAEMSLIVLSACALGLGLPLLRAWPAATFTICWAIAFLILGICMLLVQDTVFAWGVISLVLAPLGFLWNVLVSYFLVDRRRNQLQRNFSLYLSPHMVARIAESDFDMKPGGTVIEATVIFTDVEGFTSLSEQLGNLQKLSETLIEYFTRATRHVHATDGTIIKYIGDAVIAVWGAPLPDASQATHAARTALAFQGDSSIDFGGRTFRTRAGLHTGPVLAGNLGSKEQFDYTVIGDGVNFAARLESLNKQLGTSILISENTRSQLGAEFISRPLGGFRVVGKTEAVEIHELLSEGGVAPQWNEPFQAALSAFSKGDLLTARELFETVIRAREGGDGPSTFYISQIDGMPKGPLPSGWDGIVELKSK